MNSVFKLLLKDNPGKKMATRQTDRQTDHETQKSRMK